MAKVIGRGGRTALLAVIVALTMLTLRVSAQDATVTPYEPATDLGELSGSIASDGSSTVEPITSAVAEDFNAEAGDVQITVDFSGTGGGFTRFCGGETDIQNASRPIESDEQATCLAAGVEYWEFEVAYDGLSVVVNPENDFVECLTVDQLKALWEPDSTVSTWADLNPEWPADEIALYGPGPDSGTFDYFTEVIVGETDASRTDYTPSEDDNVLVEGVAGDSNALGYFGYAYYEQNQDRLKLVSVDNGSGCVAPSPETVQDSSYAPLSRPLYVYVKAESLTRPEVQEFMRFYLANAATLAPEVGYVASPVDTYVSDQAKLEGAIAGSVEPDGPPADGGTPAA